jgi:hypothetical protein
VRKILDTTPLFLAHLRDTLAVKGIARVTLHEPLTNLRKVVILQFARGVPRTEVWRALYGVLINKSVCGVRVTNSGNEYKKQYFSYAFAPTPHPGPRTAAMGPQRWADSKEPDAKVLAEIYGSKLLKLLPRVE